MLYRQQIQNEIRGIDNQLNQMRMQRQGMDFGMQQQQGLILNLLGLQHYTII